MAADSSANSENGSTSLGAPLAGVAFTAALTCNDLAKSLAFYQDVVGFDVDQKYEREGKLQAVSLKAGDVRLLIGQDDGAKGWDRVKGQGISMQITTDQNVDEAAERMKAAGGVLAVEPMNTPWGARMFRITDPDGFMLVISSR